MTTEQRDIILNEIIINNPKIKADLLQACEGAQIDYDKLKEVLPPAAFVSKSPKGVGPQKAVVHRFWKPHTKDTLTTASCRDILTWLSKYGELLTSDVNKFIDLVLRETRCPVTFNGALDLIHNNILDVLYTADIIKPSKLTLHRHFDVDQNPLVDNPAIYVRTIKQSRKEQNNKDYDLFEENNMNIYEQLNKINDNDSLSEKYNVKNVKELKKLQESLDLDTWRKIKQFADNPNTTGLEFAYSGPYADEVAVLYGEVVEEYNENNEVTIEPSASVQNGRGASEIYSDDGGYASIDFETECDQLLEFAREATSEKEFKQLILGHIYSFVELLEYEDDEELTEDLSNPEQTKKCKDKANKILSELESENFTEPDIVTVCRMIEDLIEQRYPETYKTDKQKLKSKFPDLDI